MTDIDATVGAAFDAGVLASAYHFTGDGSTVAFTITGGVTDIPNVQSLIITIDGVTQHTDTYTTSGAVVTFGVAPPLNADIQIRYNAYLGTAADAANITYSQGGTGASSRTVENKLQESVSVKDFGAVGDGVTDDTTAIQAALNASSTVYFPTGEYQCTKTTTITVNANQHIYGDGIGLTILKGFNSTDTGKVNLNFHDFSVEESNKPFTYTTCNKVQVNRVKVIGDSTETSPRGFEFIECDDCSVTNSEFVDVQYGVYWKLGASGLGFESNRGLVQGCTFKQSDVTMSYPAGIYVVAILNLVIDSNHFNCTAASNNGYGIYQGDNTTQQCIELVITNNTFKDTHYSDIRIARCSQVVIKGNSSRKDARGIFLYSNGGNTDVVTGLHTNNVVVSDNICLGTGIHVAGMSENFNIYNNIIDGASYGMRFLGDSFNQTSGTHDGSNGVDTLTDSTQSWTVNDFVGGKLKNLTDGSVGSIQSNTATTITANMSSGTWDSGDVYEVPVMVVKDINVINNVVKNIQKTGILFSYVHDAEVIGNTITDGNLEGVTDNTSDRVAGIYTNVGQNISMYDNKISNFNGGLLRYGITVNADITYAAKKMYDRNHILNMVVADYKVPYTAAPTEETWHINDRVIDITPNAAGVEGWICIAEGSQGTLNSGSTTGGITSGLTSLVVNDNTGLEVGQFITIAGVTGTKRITKIEHTTITINSASDATVAAAAVAWSAATFKTFGTISA